MIVYVAYGTYVHACASTRPCVFESASMSVLAETNVSHQSILRTGGRLGFIFTIYSGSELHLGQQVNAIKYQEEKTKVQ